MEKYDNEANRQGLRVIVTGGRSFGEYDVLKELLDSLLLAPGIHMLAHGACTGADALAHRWCIENSVPVKAFKADWKLHGIRAGPIRNKKMLEDVSPNVVVVFPGGMGTQHMRSLAISRGCRVIDVGGRSEAGKEPDNE